MLAATLWAALQPEPMRFSPWPPAPSLRTTEGGSVSSGVPPALVGLDRGRPAPAAPADLCAALFAEPTEASAVPVAFFTDHYCPNCRAMAATLEDQPGVAVTLHELPLLGEGSLVAARAALAADLQGGREAFRRRMRRASFAPTEAYLRDLARGLGLDPDRLLADMRGGEVAARLRRDLDLAAALGFGVVPVTVVGRTVVPGSIPAAELSRLVEVEREAGPLCPLGG